MNDNMIIHQNNTNLRLVLDAVMSCTHDKHVRAAAQKLRARVIDGDGLHVVGISADRGLPFIGYAKDIAATYDTDLRKVASLAKFYRKYVDTDVADTLLDKLTANVLMQADRLGFSTAESLDY